MSGAPPRQRQGALIATLAALAALQPLSLDMYMPAMPTIASAFAVSAGAVQLTLSIALVGAMIGMLATGTISDRIGRRPPVLAGMLLFALGSAGCALAPNLDWMIGMRLFQAISAGGAFVAARAVLSDLYEPREMARHLSVLSLISGLTPVIAPILGGLVLAHAGWRAIFWFQAWFGVAAFAVAFFVLAETRTAQASTHARAESLLSALAALLANTQLMRHALCFGFTMAALFTYLANAANLFILRFGVSEEMFGVYFGVNAFGMIVANQLNHSLLKHFEPAILLRWSLRFSVVFAILLAVFALFDAGKWAILLMLFPIVAAVPFTNNNVSALAQGEDRQRGGAVAALCGALGSLLAAAFATLSSVLYDGTAGPMALCILTCTGLAVLSAPRLSIVRTH